MRTKLIAAVALLLCASIPAYTADLPIEKFVTEYCGTFDVSKFKCTSFDPPRDNFIARVCYHALRDLMLIQLNAKGYCYCHLGPTFDAFVQADGMGSFYANQIRHNATGGKYFCKGIDRR